MIKKYLLEYDFHTLAEVEIDESKATPHIKEMVEFWSGWVEDLGSNDGDYTWTWLKRLTSFIVHSGRIPRDDDEGWMIGEGYGIKVKFISAWEMDEEAISIQEIPG